MATDRPRTRRLSEAQARTCEAAHGDVCKCRCGGAFHGALRGMDFIGPTMGTTPRAFFESLDSLDPHHVPTAEERKTAKNLQRLAARLRRKSELLLSQHTQPGLPFYDVTERLP